MDCGSIVRNTIRLTHSARMSRTWLSKHLTFFHDDSRVIKYVYAVCGTWSWTRYTLPKSRFSSEITFRASEIFGISDKLLLYLVSYYIGAYRGCSFSSRIRRSGGCSRERVGFELLEMGGENSAVIYESRLALICLQSNNYANWNFLIIEQAQWFLPRRSVTYYSLI